MSAPPAADNRERFPDLHTALDSQSAVAEANRCLFCFDAPCTAACPTHIDVPRFIKKISTDNLKGSALTILNANILGLSCSRVCPVEVLCEGSCVMLRYNKKPIEIGRLQRYAMDWFYSVTPAAMPPVWLAGAKSAGVTVACVGGGPASMACAAELRQRGVAVTVFDNRPLPGGLNTYGVAEYKLRAADAQHEVELLRSLGVEFRRAEVGSDGVTLEQLEKDFSFIFLGIGLGGMERMGIPGEDLAGVMDALRFIERYKTGPNFALAGRIAVIGGGNTAIDAANAARRLGADHVHLFYRRTEREMPAFAFEYDRSKVEGVQFHWLAQPLEILGRDGSVAGVRFAAMQPGAPDASGRRSVTATGSTFDVACEMVIPALGQSRLTALLAARGIHTIAGAIVVDRPTGRTANEKYYAGGDCVNGGREVVDAVADGKRAAVAMSLAAEVNHG
ncbi:MAG TPA: NAD(P)-dependent oxidoreductase [Bryobacteraceae bacterium]|nr:NAD(P)-dependent oxidoreductase [Bryobacteraceae bacterium]